MTAPDPAALRDLLGPAFEQLGIELVEVQWRGSGGRGLLRLIVDRPGGVDLDDCESASMAASAILDAYDPIDVAYSLEVSSPGAERPIRTEDEWRAAVGRKVHVRFRSGEEAEQVVEGRLLAAGGPSLEIEARVAKGRPRLVSVPAASVLAARIAVDI
ncbi:MAG: ribosome maturation factor RimP [Candidatus Dormiibacterota bacterium]